MGPEDWDARYAASPGLEWGAGPNAWVAAQAGDLPPGPALDLGAGEGRNAVWLAERGWRVTAVDFSGVGLQKGRRLADARHVTGHVDWVQADVVTYDVRERAYDLVLLSYLHLPAPQRRATTRNAASALAPGGTLLVIGHDRRNLTHGVGGPQDPAILFTARDVLSDIAGTDLVPLVAGEHERPVPTADDVRQVAIDAVVRLTRPVHH